MLGISFTSSDILMKRVNLLSQENRLSTFKNWPYKHPWKCTTEKLSEAGFYFTGDDHNKDLVECFFCKKKLEGWDKEDVPWQEHVKHSPNCEFIKLGKPEDELTLNQMLALKESLIMQVVKEMFESIDDAVKAEDDAFLDDLS